MIRFLFYSFMCLLFFSYGFNMFAVNIGEINGEKITLKEYKNWLYKNVSNKMYIENYVTAYLFKEKYMEMGLKISKGEFVAALKKRLKNFKYKINHKSPFYKKQLNVLKEELWGDLRASKIYYGMDKSLQNKITNIFYNEYGYLGKKYKLKILALKKRTEKDKIINKILAEYKKGVSFDTLKRKYENMNFTVDGENSDEVNKWILNSCGKKCGDELNNLKEGDIKILKLNKVVYFVKVTKIFNTKNKKKKFDEIRKKLCPIPIDVSKILQLGVQLEKEYNVYY